MVPSVIQQPSWPLGAKFVDSQGRSFEVVQTIFGDADNYLTVRWDFSNGWSVITQGEDYPQTGAGFVQTGTENLIIQKVSDLDEFVTNGHLKRI